MSNAKKSHNWTKDEVHKMSASVGGQEGTGVKGCKGRKVQGWEGKIAQGQEGTKVRGLSRHVQGCPQTCL